MSASANILQRVRATEWVKTTRLNIELQTEVLTQLISELKDSKIENGEVSINATGDSNSSLS